MRIDATITLSIRPRPNQAPVWQQEVTLEITSGTPATFDIKQYVSDPDGDPLVLGLVSFAPTLPGVSFNPQDGILTYDGTLIPEGTAQIVFSADDGQG